MLTDVPISWDINVTKKEAEKILEYEELTVEIQGMCKVKTKVTRLNKANRTISESLRKGGATYRESTKLRN